MAKVNYTNLKLKTDTSVNKFTFNDTEIEVLKYLPVEDKYDLIMITLQRAKEKKYYNPLKVDMFFHLHLVYLYSNLTFTEKQKESPEKIYDALTSNGFMEKFIAAMEPDEYNYLLDFIEEIIDTEMKYGNSAASVINSIIQDLPENAQAAADIMNSFDKTKFEEVVKFAEAANGGRPIVQNISSIVNK